MTRREPSRRRSVPLVGGPTSWPWLSLTARAGPARRAKRWRSNR